ncbi:conserved protein of unknown function [Georgfuchsia toluolica]|uniref:DUF1993 domain-containing protein n=1 Tax=Georgfuchsia toluolica TaxID=424218 RepID=A0A916J594_9PROT|nr:DUF1993 domain-containing protein [Georgfuchsia toluolica]CAG4884797.1 conserved protein of unknown function [Georgfuchsia toluolica]
MAISLYDISVMNYQQTLGAVSHILKLGLAHCQSNHIDLETFVETRMYHDMLPFRFQIQSVAYHSLGAIEGIKNGIFRPPSNLPEDNYEALQTLINETNDALGKLSATEINAMEGAEVIFEFRDHRIPFTAESFLLSFSLPNFYFHATTAYDILRSKGVVLGKRDYLGGLRLKR